MEVTVTALFSSAAGAFGSASFIRCRLPITTRRFQGAIVCRRSWLPDLHWLLGDAAEKRASKICFTALDYVANSLVFFADGLPKGQSAAASWHADYRRRNRPADSRNLRIDQEMAASNYLPLQHVTLFTYWNGVQFFERFVSRWRSNEILSTTRFV